MTQRLLVWLPYLFSRLGWAGSMGLLSLAVASALHVFVIRLQAETNQIMQREWETLSRNAHANEPSSQQRDSVEGLAPTVRAPEAIARLFAAADKAGLLLEQGEYRQLSEKDSGLTQYQITLPLVGSYPAVHAFLLEAMQQEPGLALDGLRLSRESVEESQLDAQMQLTLYLREGA
jgi:hypothetical protein